MSYIQVRIDEKTKKSAKKILDKIGIDMSSAIKIYLKQIIITKSIPMTLTTENGLSPNEELQINKAHQEALQNINTTAPMTSTEAINYLKKL